MHLTLWQYLILAVLVGFAGFVDAIAGGGGLITVPAYLAIGLPTNLVLGTNKCVSTIGTSLAVIRYIRGKTVIWRLAACGIVTALIGSFLGARLSAYLSKTYMLAILIILVPAILYLQYRQRSLPAHDGVDSAAITRSMMAWTALISLVIGAYDGLFGPGTGTFLLVAFLVILEMNSLQAAANARIVNFASNIAAFVYFMVYGGIDWGVAGIGIAASLCGNWLGSGLALRKTKGVIFPMFRFVLVLLLLKCGYDICTLHL